MARAGQEGEGDNGKAQNRDREETADNRREKVSSVLKRDVLTEK